MKRYYYQEERERRKDAGEQTFGNRNMRRSIGNAAAMTCPRTRHSPAIHLLHTVWSYFHVKCLPQERCVNDGCLGHRNARGETHWRGLCPDGGSTANFTQDIQS
jgi:hypothetical protein